MPKEEIIAGLKQAITRGYSLELAKQSFINAGYNSKEVEEASSSLGGVITEFPQFHQTQEAEEIRAKQPQQIKQQIQFPAKKHRARNIIIIILVIILAVILLAFLGILIGMLLSPDATKELIKSLFSFIP